MTALYNPTIIELIHSYPKIGHSLNNLPAIKDCSNTFVAEFKLIAMKTFLRIILIFSLIVFAYNANATTNEAALPGNFISGKVVDQTSGTPMEYVTVALYKSTDSSLVSGAITDPEGLFKIEKVDAGSYYLLASFIGYENKRLPEVSLSKKFNKTDLGTIELVPETSEITEVKVVAEKARIEYKLDKRVVNVDKDLSAKGGTAVDALQNTPSVQVDPQGNLTLRGSSEYVVLIDGKPSILKGSDALKQIPAGAIKQIEVVTNPSAKYEADGQAGIINVIMKKEMLQGFSGNVNFGIATNDKQNGNLMLNYRLKKVNLYVGADYADNTYRNTIKINTKTTLNSVERVDDGFTEEFNTNDNMAVKGGIDYDINDKNNLSLSGSYSRQGYDFGSFAENANWFGSNPKVYTTNDNYTDIFGDVARVNFDYKHTFNENSDLQVSNTFSSWSGVDENNMVFMQTNDLYEDGELLSKLNSYKDNSNFNNRLNIDYKTPLWKGSFEAGVQFRYEDRMEDMNYRNYTIATNEWVKNETYSYRLDYLNSIYSGYALFSKEIFGINSQLGIRSEYFTREMVIEGIITDSLNYNKFMFYPSVHLSKSFKNNHQLQASYSRRIKRPQPYVLNTVPRYIDANNIFIGNTALTPEFTDGFELNYMAPVGKSNLSVQTYYKRTSSPMTTIRYLGEDGKMYHQLTNGKYQQSYGVELNANINLLTWWSVNANGNFYNYKINSEVKQSDVELTTNTWDAHLVNNLKFEKGTSLQAVVYYRAPGVDAAGKTDGFYIVNLSANQSFLKGSLNLTLKADNIFNSVKFKYHTDGDGFNNDYFLTNEGASFSVNISYKFNNFKSKKQGRADDTEFKGGGGF
jgi:outer membrane receptor protein involved in Fe transport